MARLDGPGDRGQRRRPAPVCIHSCGPSDPPMGQAWDAERVVDAVAASELIERQFPALAPARVEPLGAGWDNPAFTGNGDFVFRSPRRQVAVPFLEAECRILPGLARRLP